MTKKLSILHNKLKKETLKNPAALAEYKAFKLELEVAQQLRAAREKAHLSQEQVAESMKTHKPAIARLEAAGGKQKHSPSLKTLMKYANAVGFDLRITLISRKKHAHIH